MSVHILITADFLVRIGKLWIGNPRTPLIFASNLNTFSLKLKHIQLFGLLVILSNDVKIWILDLHLTPYGF